MDELDELRQRVRSAPLAEPPAPWTTLGTVVVGGITDVGFADDSDLLLILSGHSREIADCQAGKLAARDTATEARSTWYGRHDLVGNGFGPLNGRQVRLAGASGGGLVCFSRDGWGAIRLPIDWPDEYLVLTAPYTSIFQSSAQFWKLAAVREPIAFGFSFTGQSLVAVTADEVHVYGRR